MDPIDLVEKGKIKRFFRATRKLKVPDLVYHITQRAAGREPLFLEDGDYLVMLGLLKEIAQSRFLKIHAFCLMPNHLHLLLTPQQANISEAMRDLFSRYATWFNRKYERKGHLFGGPYRQAVCLGNSYILAASIYIHLNPLKAGLTTDPGRYRWSSIRLYCEDGAPKSFVNSDFILGLLSDDGVKGKQRYRSLLNDSSHLPMEHVLEQEEAIEGFRSKLISRFSALFRHLAEGKQGDPVSRMGLLTMEDLDEQIHSLRKDPLFNKPCNRDAKRHLIEQLVARGYKRAEIAERLGISIKSVYNILKS